MYSSPILYSVSWHTTSLTSKVKTHPSTTTFMYSIPIFSPLPWNTSDFFHFFFSFFYFLLMHVFFLILWCTQLLSSYLYLEYPGFQSHLSQLYNHLICTHLLSSNSETHFNYSKNSHIFHALFLIFLPFLLWKQIRNEMYFKIQNWTSS